MEFTQRYLFKELVNFSRIVPLLCATNNSFLTAEKGAGGVYAEIFVERVSKLFKNSTSIMRYKQLVFYRRERS
jgi:hypothetical protein